MQKRNCKTRLGFVATAIITQLVLISSARSELKLQKFQEKIDGAPVEVYFVAEDGAAPAASWRTLPLNQPYPAPGMSLPELAARDQMLVSVNANFYREDRPSEQEPIGLTVSDGHVLTPPNSMYPTIGMIGGRLEWDNVKLVASAEVVANGKTYREKICRFNSRATAGCASLWLAKTPEKLTNIVFIKADGLGPKLGHMVYNLQADKVGAWGLQWPTGIVGTGASQVTLTVKLIGTRLGDRWDSVAEAVSGSHLLSPQKIFPPLTRSWAIVRQPRTMVGVDRNGFQFVVVFDGRRETSRGVSVRAAWEFLRARFGAQWAVNLDGGGSSTMVYDGRLVNKPSDVYPRALAVGWGAKVKLDTPVKSN